MSLLSAKYRARFRAFLTGALLAGAPPLPAAPQEGTTQAPPPATTAPAPALPEELVWFFSGDWVGKGAFASGRPLEATVSFTPDLDGRWLVMRHADLPPNTHKVLGHWGIEQASGRPILSLHDSAGAIRILPGDGWKNGRIVFGPATPGLERFTFEQAGPKAFRLTRETSSDGRTWRLEHRLTFTRPGQKPPPLPPLPAGVGLPMLPGSDPLIHSTYTWTLAHSPSLQDLVRKLILAERKARYRFVPGLEQRYGRLVVLVTKQEYEIDIQVPILAWNRCGDALEPWIASALYLAYETASKGKLEETANPNHFHFLKETMRAAFAFQGMVRRELVAADPERLKDLPDGERLYESGFRPVLDTSGRPLRRPLPEVAP
ncbi:MAG TPA: hypothetical protein VJ463_01755 [Geothrix sp.]|nr:hypothetical protein [Geothrix sp.]